MSRRRFPWDRLGIDETTDSAAIRKAYADALRATNVDEDIAGYAELRRARDHALWLAANAARAEEEEDNLGLGSLDDAPEAYTDDDWFDDDGLWDGDPFDDSPRPYRPGPLAPAPDPELTAAQVEAQAAWNRLLAILYPEGEPSEEAMSLAEMDEGLAALAMLTARAEAADLAEHDALDGALAELFARTWPRSAPFVEPAAEAFHWLDEAGALEERPALRFLNQRLKGMRFHEKVQQADHPLHRAWAELSKPGTAGVLDRLRVKRTDVHKLIDGIRRNFPELESHLDPQRVASWDAGGSGEAGTFAGASRGFRGWVLTVVLIFAAVRVLALFGAASGDSSGSGSPPLVVAASDAEVDAKLAEIFGAGTDMKAVRAADPVLADQLRAAVNRPEIALPLDLVRMKALASAEIAKRPELEARAELKAMWLTAARARKDDTCRRLMDGNLEGLALDLSEKDRAREQVLLHELLAAKVLGHIPKGGEVRYAIPGWLVADTLKRSGLPEKRLVAAFGDPAAADRCAAETALAQAATAALAKVPDEVLKGL
ncbi:hypothetical protein ACLBKU_07780 [Erythrobacter sp. NE805]|uniref:hypothetical protein n=1 Tax=Erythrobacter sp. NE805 TaxID=3389875 RepID=UPI00396B0822